MALIGILKSNIKQKIISFRIEIKGKKLTL